VPSSSLGATSYFLPAASARKVTSSRSPKYLDLLHFFLFPILVNSVLHFSFYECLAFLFPSPTSCPQACGYHHSPFRCTPQLFFSVLYAPLEVLVPAYSYPRSLLTSCYSFPTARCPDQTPPGPQPLQPRLLHPTPHAAGLSLFFPLFFCFLREKLTLLRSCGLVCYSPPLQQLFFSPLTNRSSPWSLQGYVPMIAGVFDFCFLKRVHYRPETIYCLHVHVFPRTAFMVIGY